MPRGFLQEVSSLLDDLAHSSTRNAHGCLGRKAGNRVLPLAASRAEEHLTDQQVSKPQMLLAPNVSSFLDVGAPSLESVRTLSVRTGSCASSNGAPCEAIVQRASNHSPSTRTSFWWWDPYKCKYSDWDKTKDCGECPNDCNSDDCYSFKGKCVQNELGRDVRDNKKWINYNKWYYYYGASRPYKDTGDWIRFGDVGLAIQPGTGKQKNAKDQTPGEKNGKDGKAGADVDAGWEGKPWIEFYIPGRQKRFEVKSLSRWQPVPPMVEPYSSEAANILAEYTYNKGKRPKGSWQYPCDKMGRILGAQANGSFCKTDQVCITSLPEDFWKTAGQSCMHEIHPPCPEKEFGDLYHKQTREIQDMRYQIMQPIGGSMWTGYQYMPPIQQQQMLATLQRNHEAQQRELISKHCPAYPDCPVPKPCKEPYWENVCKTHRGEPWCVSHKALKAYKGPIEINCPAVGDSHRTQKGDYTGCWWLTKFVKSDYQRLPGKIKRSYADSSGWFVRTGQGKNTKNMLSEKQAKDWIVGGRWKKEKDPDANSEFLKKAAPKKA